MQRTMQAWCGLTNKADAATMARSFGTDPSSENAKCSVSEFLIGPGRSSRCWSELTVPSGGSPGTRLSSATANVSRSLRRG